MKKVMELLNEVVEMGFDREEALQDIDVALDGVYGEENRPVLAEEEIPEKLYDDILFGFKCELEERE